MATAARIPVAFICRTRAWASAGCFCCDREGERQGEERREKRENLRLSEEEIREGVRTFRFRHDDLIEISKNSKSRSRRRPGSIYK